MSLRSLINRVDVVTFYSYYKLLTICEKGQVVMVNSLCKQLHSVYPIEARSMLRQVPMTL